MERLSLVSPDSQGAKQAEPDASVTSILNVSLSELVKIQIASSPYNFSIVFTSLRAKTNILYEALTQCLSLLSYNYSSFLIQFNSL